MPDELTFEKLKSAVSGSAAAFRCRNKLQPAGGKGDKVFPPTYAGAKYADEKRKIPERPEPVPCVLLDSVQSQANRMEEALQMAVNNGDLAIPLIQVDFSDYAPTGNEEEDRKNGKFRDDIGKITSLQVPHRLADAILRDSQYAGIDFPILNTVKASTRQALKMQRPFFSFARRLFCSECGIAPAPKADWE